jgi:hypothetical protein
VLADRTTTGSPAQWGEAAVRCHDDFDADDVVALPREAETSLMRIMFDSRSPRWCTRSAAWSKSISVVDVATEVVKQCGPSRSAYYMRSREFCIVAASISWKPK